MAKKQATNDTSSVKTQTFTKGLIKDISDSYFPDDSWGHAVNAVNVTTDGDIGTLSNEQSNTPCGSVPNLPNEAPFQIIGKIHLYEAQWVLFATNGTTSQVGWYNENNCNYCTIVKDPCLDFDVNHLITGKSKKNFDCSWQIYWADGKNPDRSMNIGNPDTWQCIPQELQDQTPWPGVPYLEKCDYVDPILPDCTEPDCVAEGCLECQLIQPLQLDCNKIRLVRLIKQPCVTIKKGISGGNMPNGSYYVVIAYSINQQRVTDYFSPSNIQPLFAHSNLAGSLDITINDLDREFYSEFELVVVYTVNQQTVAKQVGFYSTHTGSITLDSIDITTPSVPLELIPVRTTTYEKSEQISQINNYLVRMSPTTGFDFNYQPLANRIETKWVAIEYPVDYYRNGGNRTSYLRDEIYAFWIRWVYDTGDKTPSYHIPGRPPQEDISLLCPDLNVCDLENVKGYQDNIFNDSCLYDVYNTGYVTENLIQQGTTYTLEDGGVVVAKGRMGYWQSTERYPDTKAPIWNTSANFWSSYSCQGLAYGEAEVDLCGQYIRHHKMPDNKCVPHFKSNNIVKPNQFYSSVDKIVILGVEFENIGFPVDNDGIPIPGIVGYEILRGSREGNKSIIAKGMLNNMREYDISEGVQQYNPLDSGEVLGYGLYQNYPYNYLGADPTLQSNQTLVGAECATPSVPLTEVSTNKFTFHSPDFQFREPFLAEKELKIYGEIFGDVTGNYDEVPGHPEHKILSNFSLFISAFAGLGIAALSLLGKKSTSSSSARAFNLGNINYDNVDQELNLGQIVTPFGNIFQLDVPLVSEPNQNFSGTADVPGDDGQTQNQLTTANQNTNTQANNAESNQIDTLIKLVQYISNPEDKIVDTPVSSYVDNVLNNNVKGYIGPGYDINIELSPSKMTQSLGGQVANFLYYWSQGTDSVINFIEAWVPFEQYALMYRSHGYYTQFSPSIFCQPNYQRRLINQIFYLDANIQNLNGTYPLGPAPDPKQYTINNLFRNKCVVVELNGDLNITDNPDIPLKFFKENAPYTGTCLYNPPSYLSGYSPVILPDNTLQSLATLSTLPILSPADPFYGLYNYTTFNNWYLNPTKEFSTRTRALYGAVKYRNRNQYGQLELVRQIIASDCPILINRFPDPEQEICSFDIKYNSGIIFGGDTYIGRYTEKNKFFYFYDWLYEQPDGTPLDYTLKPMIQYPTYWADLTGFDLGAMITSIVNLSFVFSPLSTRVFPSQYHNLDRFCLPFDPFGISSLVGLGTQSGLFNVMNAYFYLFNTGVRDFIVESEINIDLRDWDELPEQRFYDPYRYTDLEALFDTSIIKADNYYKYDYSLSVARIFNSFISWGNMQPRYYDPLIAETCYQYYPNRLLYSLPAELEQVKDNWYAYLANNYKDFQSKPNSINAINKNGAMITFEYDGPLMYQGVDTLETELNTKITIGDGGLFSQPGQSVVNADVSYEYGSCQDKFSVLSTPYGIFYISQNQSKVFHFAGSLKEISAVNMRYWFDKYLRYRILLDFPDFPLTDNPVAGVGCQTIYDNNDQIVYFTKKDYKLRTEYKGRVTFTELDPDTEQVINRFTLDEMTYFYLNDDLFNTVFEDASWTISYDPKAESWISFHDWHPDLLLPARNNFISVRNNGLWRHNFVTNSYCNFYGVDYKFEVEYPVSTGQAVNTIRSLEYILEPYIYDADGIDQYNVIDWNFNNAVIYNIEQVSGVLNLNMTPKNDVIGRLQYPIVNATNIDIACSKEENKYRFNQFWDITDDRGEFPTPTGFAQRPIWDTAANGYDRILNPANLNYDKSPLQRKKFRHYVNYVVLSRINRGDDPRNVQMILKITNTKNLYSPR